MMIWWWCIINADPVIDMMLMLLCRNSKYIPSKRFGRDFPNRFILQKVHRLSMVLTCVPCVPSLGRMSTHVNDIVRVFSIWDLSEISEGSYSLGKFVFPSCTSLDWHPPASWRTSDSIVRTVISRKFIMQQQIMILIWFDHEMFWFLKSDSAWGIFASPALAAVNMFWSSLWFILTYPRSYYDLGYVTIRKLRYA